MLPYGEYDNNLHFNYNPEDAKNIKSVGDKAKPKQILAELQFNNHSVLKHSYDHEDDIGNDAQPIYWDEVNGVFKTINLENLARALKDYLKGYFEPNINILSFSVSGKDIIDYNESTTLTANLDGGNANNTQWSWKMIEEGNYGTNNINYISSFAPSDGSSSSTLTIVANNQPSYEIPTPSVDKHSPITLHQFNVSGGVDIACLGISVFAFGLMKVIYINAYNPMGDPANIQKRITINPNTNFSSINPTEYLWIKVSGSEYITLKNNTKSICHIDNTNFTTNDKVAKIKCRVTSGNLGYKDSPEITINVDSLPVMTESIQWVCKCIGIFYL